MIYENPQVRGLFDEPYQGGSVVNINALVFE